MDHYLFFCENLKKSKIVLMPKGNISTFGTTTYSYYFLGKINEKTTYLKEGNVNINNPFFITPYTDERVFEGFPNQMKEHFKKFLKEIRSTNRMWVNYLFENISRHSWEEKISLPEALSDIKSSCEGNPHATILIGNKNFWEPSLCKFCLKIFERSLPNNISEIEEKGFLDEHGIPSKMVKHIEKMFDQAEGKLNKVNRLGDFLVEHDLFEIYEERFFSLMKRTKVSK